MKKRMSIAGAVACAVAVGVAAPLSAAAAGKSAAGGQTASVKMADFKFTSSQLVSAQFGKRSILKPGPTAIRFTNTGKFGHDFTIVTTSTGATKFGSGVIAPGKSKTIRVTLKAGAYLAACLETNGTHFADGMVKVFTVGRFDPKKSTWSLELEAHASTLRFDDHGERDVACPSRRETELAPNSTGHKEINKMRPISKTMWIALAALLSAGGISTATAISSTDHGSRSPETRSFTLQQPSGGTVDFLDVGAAGNSVGDSLFFSDTLLDADANTTVGSQRGACETVDVAAGASHCFLTVRLGDSQADTVEAAGEFFVNDDGTVKRDAVFAIVGGTGRYLGAGGQIKITNLSPDGAKAQEDWILRAEHDG